MLILDGHISDHDKMILSKKIHIVTQIPVFINGSQDRRVQERQQEYIETLMLNLQHPQVCVTYGYVQLAGKIRIVLCTIQ